MEKSKSEENIECQHKLKQSIKLNNILFKYPQKKQVHNANERK